jgi:hypothetical protein
VELGENVCSEAGGHKAKVFRNPSAIRPPLQPNVSGVNNESSAETQARFSAYQCKHSELCVFLNNWFMYLCFDVLTYSCYD